jgi:hypothetical protein
VDEQTDMIAGFNAVQNVSDKAAPLLPFITGEAWRSVAHCHAN